MENKIKGKVIDISDVEEVANGKYHKVNFVVKNNDGYEGAEKIYAFEMFSKNEDDSKVSKFLKHTKVGKAVEVNYNIECNEGKGKSAGRYFTKLSAWSVFSDKDAQADAEEEDDVPF